MPTLTAERPSPQLDDLADDWWHARLPQLPPRGLAPLRELNALPREYNCGGES